MEASLRPHDDLANRLDLVLSVFGIGQQTAITLIVRTPELGHISREQAAALAGVAPFDQDSGRRSLEERALAGACRYEPGISRTYQDMASHYGTAVLPARVRRPRDKAKVEVAVQVVQRWRLARLGHQRFFSLAELNAAILSLMIDLNDRPMRHLGTSRRALFETLERPALLALPALPYVYAERRRCRAGLDYHVEVQGHCYSVPYRLMREIIEARITDQTVELFHRGNRVAGHLRSPRAHRHTTTAEHMPSAHNRYAEWTPTRLLREAAAIGPATIALEERNMAAKPHPEQGFRTCLGVLRLVRG